MALKNADFLFTLCLRLGIGRRRKDLLHRFFELTKVGVLELLAEFVVFFFGIWGDSHPDIVKRIA